MYLSRFAQIAAEKCGENVVNLIVEFEFANIIYVVDRKMQGCKKEKATGKA